VYKIDATNKDPITFSTSFHYESFSPVIMTQRTSAACKVVVSLCSVSQSPAVVACTARHSTYQGLQYVIYLMSLDKGCYRSLWAFQLWVSHFTMAAGIKQMEIISVMTRRETLVQFQANQDCYRKRKFRAVQFSLLEDCVTQSDW